MHSEQPRAWVRRAGEIAGELLFSAALFFGVALSIVLVRPLAVGAGIAPEAYGLLSGGVLFAVLIYIALRGFP